MTTLAGEPTRTTPVRQPTTAQDAVADLHALLAAANAPGPYVLVGQSWGGLVAQLYARRRPGEVRELVLVDPGQSVPARHPGAGGMAPFPGVGQQARRPRPLRRMPTVVLTADRPFDYGAGPGTWPAWGAAQARLAQGLHARHITRTNSGHVIQMFRPGLVSREIRSVVRDVRAGRRAAG